MKESTEYCHAFNNNGYCIHCGQKRKSSTTSTLNGKWPSDTWFQRARARKMRNDSELLLKESSVKL